MTVFAPLLAAAAAKLSAHTLVLEGEVAIYDLELRSRFEWLREPDPDAVATPPMFLVFDLLHRNGHDLTGRPLRERRARLEDAVADNDLVLPVRRLAEDGLQAWAQVIERGYEGSGSLARQSGDFRWAHIEGASNGLPTAGIFPNEATLVSVAQSL